MDPAVVDHRLPWEWLSVWLPEPPGCHSNCHDPTGPVCCLWHGPPPHGDPGSSRYKLEAVWWVFVFDDFTSWPSPLSVSVKKTSYLLSGSCTVSLTHSLPTLSLSLSRSPPLPSLSLSLSHWCGLNWFSSFSELSPSRCIHILSWPSGRLQKWGGRVVGLLNIWSPCDKCITGKGQCTFFITPVLYCLWGIKSVVRGQCSRRFQ